MEEIKNTLTEMGFTMEQGDTIIGKRNDWGDSLVGNTNVKLMFNGVVIYDDVYSRGLGLLPDVLAKPVVEPMIYNKDVLPTHINEWVARMERFDELKGGYTDKSHAYMVSLLKKDGDSEKRSEMLEYIKLSNIPLKKDFVLSRDSYINFQLNSKLRQEGVSDWFNKKIDHLREQVLKLDKQEQDEKDWEEKVGGVSVECPVELTDVIHSVFLDATEESFEGFCDCYGYDTDSRKAYAIWVGCKKTHEKISSHMSSEQIEKVNELLQDY